MQGRQAEKGRRSFRQPPPDYTQRGPWLRVFLMVAAVIAVLAVAERTREPQSWKWLWDLDKSDPDKAAQREPIQNRLPDKPATGQGEVLVTADAPLAGVDGQGTIDPAARAWQEGWRDVYGRLSSADRDLLFEMLHAVQRHQALPAEKAGTAADLLALATTLWEDYQAAAFQAVAQLKGDDQTQWVDVLRQVNGRFSDDLRPALQAVIDGRTPTENEERALGGLRSTLVALTTAQIEDDTVFRPAEREILFHLQAEVRDAEPQELKQRSLGQVTYLQLFKQPKEYRGRVVSVKGTVRLAYRVQAPANHLGIKEHFVYWIYPDGGPSSPIVVYALEAPAGFPAIADRDLDRKTTKLREDVTVTGVFFKRWAYPAQEGATYTAPMLLARVPAWRPNTLDLTAGRAGLSRLELGAAVIAALLMAACITAVLWYRTHRPRPADEFAPPNIADLQNIKLRPTTHEALRNLERDARVHPE